MKSLNSLPSLLATMLFLGSHGMAQSADSRVPNTQPDLVVAHCRYAPADDACAHSGGPSQASNENADVLLGQLPRRRPMPAPRARRPIPPPYAAYPGPSMTAGSGRHALIGALIGFGVVTAVASRGNGGVGASLAFGVLGAGIGAGMGLAFPPFPARYVQSPSWPDEDPARDEAASGHRRRTAQREPSHMVALRSESPNLPGTAGECHATSANLP